MLLNSISIINFKNILSVDLHFSPNINCFIGSNGMGKTNFLDAVYLMSFCRSAFNPVDSQLITHGKDFFTIEGVYSGEDGHQENIYCGMKRGTRKHFKRDKRNISVFPSISDAFRWCLCRRLMPLLLTVAVSSAAS